MQERDGSWKKILLSPNAPRLVSKIFTSRSTIVGHSSASISDPVEESTWNVWSFSPQKWSRFALPFLDGGWRQGYFRWQMTEQILAVGSYSRVNKILHFACDHLMLSYPALVGLQHRNEDFIVSISWIIKAVDCLLNCAEVLYIPHRCLHRTCAFPIFIDAKKKHQSGSVLTLP